MLYFPHMTVKENLEFPLEVRKMKKSEIDEKVSNALSMVELTRFWKSYAFTIIWRTTTTCCIG